MSGLTFDNEVWRDKLHCSGLRATAARLAIIRVLEESQGAISATEVMDRLEFVGMDRVTVYRTLGSLVECGLAHRLDPGDRVWRFTLQEQHASGAHDEHGVHPHFVCDVCGTISCMERARAEVQLNGHASDGYVIRGQETVLRGLCPGCAASGGNPAAAKALKPG